MERGEERTKMTVGQRIRKRREELDLSQGDLAKLMSVSRQAVSKAELHDDNITTDKVTKFANALGVTESYLMGWEENPEDIKARLTEAYIKGNRVARLSKDEKVMKYAEYLMDMSEESRQQAFNYIDLLLLKESQNKG